MKFLRSLFLTRTDYTRRERLIAMAICLFVALVASSIYFWDRQNLRLSLKPDMKRSSFLAMDDQAKYTLFQKAVENEIWATLSKVRNKFVIVAIDDYTLNELDWSWPINRKNYAELVDTLAKCGAHTIGLDILFETRSDFPESDASLKETLARPEVVIPYRMELSASQPVLPHETLMSIGDEEFVARTGFTQEWSDLDGRTRKAMLSMEIEGKTYYSWDLMIASRILSQPPEEVLAGLSALEQDTLILRRARVGKDVDVPVRVRYAPLRMAGGAKKDNQMDNVLDTDEQGEELLPGIYRSDVAVDASDSQTTLDRILTYFPAAQAWTPVERGGLIGQAGGLVGPMVDEKGQPVIDPATGQPRPLPCAALVGVTATGGHDNKLTPTGYMSGLEIHGYTLASILTNGFFRSPPPWLVGLFFCICSLLAGFLMSTLSFRSASLVLLLSAAGSVMLTRHLYLHNVNWPLFPPLICLATSMLLVNIFHVVSRNQRIAQRDERIRQVQQIMRELTPVDVEELLANNGMALGGKATELTVLFSDLRGYTSMAEKLKSTEVIDRLNEYFALLGPILEKYGGAVFDYQGDALMAVFGLKPNSQPNHAAAGCKAAAATIYALERQRKEWLRQGRPMPETGIGLCTGMVAFGGLGTAQHKQFVAIGDPTNTASRMQGKSKELDSPVLITESTYQMALADEQVVMRYLEEVELKGKREPLKVYEVSVDETAAKLEVAKVAPGEAPLPKAEPIL